MADTLTTFLNSFNAQHYGRVQTANNTCAVPILTTKFETHDVPPTCDRKAIMKPKKNAIAVKNAKGKNTRPLNSFMGFRCYYSVLFEDFEQKVISTYIVFLWERDPCKAKWALAAKAYSMIRDQVGKEHAPLDVFLMLVTKLLGIVEPKNYLTVMGWEISVDGLGTVSLVKNNAVGMHSSMLTTNISVEDIVVYACQLGYASAMGTIVATPSGKQIMAMAASAQYTPVRTMATSGEQNHDQVQGAAAINQTTESADDQPVEVSTLTHRQISRTTTLPSVQNNAIATLAQPIAPLPTPAVAAINGLSGAQPLNVGNILDFNPDLTLPVFDPTEGDAWDAFDISAWVHDEAYAAENQ